MTIVGVGGNQDPQDIKLKAKQEKETTGTEKKDVPPGSAGPTIFAAADGDKNGTISIAEQKGGLMQFIDSVKNMGESMKPTIQSILSKFQTIETDGTKESADKADAQVTKSIESAKAEVEAMLAKAEAEDKTSKTDDEVKKDFNTAT